MNDGNGEGPQPVPFTETPEYVSVHAAFEAALVSMIEYYNHTTADLRRQVETLTMERDRALADMRKWRDRRVESLAHLQTEAK